MDGGCKRRGGGGLMAMELVKLNSETLPAIANAIRSKTGETALLLPSEMAAAIAGIPTGGSLPALTTPAAEKDVLAGKEYIDGSGAKKAGTLVVCDTVQEAEIIGVPGVGLTVEVESSADASSKAMTLPEPNLKSENIKSGVSIFGLAGSVKEIRTETGTITPAGDSLELELPCTANPNVIKVHMTDAAMETILTGTVNAALTAVGTNTEIKSGAVYNLKASFRSIVTVFVGSAAQVLQNTQEITMDAVILKTSSGYPWKAGCEYQWTAYYWEDT